MAEPIKVTKWGNAVFLTIVHDDEGNPMWFHPPCGVGHPFVDGKAVCPVYAQADRVIAEAAEVLKRRAADG